MVHKYVDMVAVFSSSQLKINSFLFSTWEKKNKPVVKQSTLTGIFTKIYFIKKKNTRYKQPD